MNDNVGSRNQNWSFFKSSFYNLNEYYLISQIIHSKDESTINK